MIKPLFFSWLVVSAGWAFAATENQPSAWQATCLSASPIKSLNFKSRSGDLTNDDVEVQVIWRNGDVQQLTLPEAWYSQLPNWRGSLCQGLALYPVQSGQKLLLVLSFDGRPRLDRFHVLLVDSQSHKVLDQLLDVGELAPQFRYRWFANKLQLRMVKSYKGISDGPDDLILGWREFSVNGSNLHMSWR